MGSACYCLAIAKKTVTSVLISSTACGEARREIRHDFATGIFSIWREGIAQFVHLT